jgi:hypothetical protein
MLAKGVIRDQSKLNLALNGLRTTYYVLVALKLQNTGKFTSALQVHHPPIFAPVLA